MNAWTLSRTTQIPSRTSTKSHTRSIYHPKPSRASSSACSSSCAWASPWGVGTCTIGTLKPRDERLFRRLSRAVPSPGLAHRRCPWRRIGETPARLRPRRVFCRSDRNEPYCQSGVQVIKLDQRTRTLPSSIRRLARRHPRTQRCVEPQRRIRLHCSTSTPQWMTIRIVIKT